MAGLTMLPALVAAAALAAMAAALPAAAQWGAPGRAAPAALGDGPPTVTAIRAVPARTTLTADDLILSPAPPGAGLRDPAEAIGMETRVTLAPGRPIRAADLNAPALVERNELVRLSFERGGLSIAAEGRALDRGALGDRVRAMNLGSRQTVTGRVAGPGLVEVSP